ncbi:MAG: heme-binding domain-containing protein [Verrucomicrobiales bacterium]|nr:heme-binding domain-containing protein [Verrucomicrobiales bacterium]
MLLRFLALTLLLAAPLSATELFERDNLVAWCIVPFDAQKRSPEQRAEMLSKLGLTKVAYDWREEHVPEFEREIQAYHKHGIEYFAFWGVHDSALQLFKKYDLHPQLWVMLKPSGETQEAKVEEAVKLLQPILAKAKTIGSRVGIYNHGGWGGEPENMVAVCERLRQQPNGDRIGIVYNLHHGHAHLARLPQVLALMKPWLLCLNLNGMDADGEAHGRKILPIGAGKEDLKVLRQIRASGYHGPVGILNHTQEDAEARLQDNLDGLAWLVPQLDDQPPGPKPHYRSWSESQASAGKSTSIAASPADTVASLNPDFGQALKGGLVIPDNEPFRSLPLTVECRTRLHSKHGYNILVASDVKASDTHWELYTHAKRGTLAWFMPGRGGDYDSGVDICDDQWHDLVVSVEDARLVFWIDGKQVKELPVKPFKKGASQPGGLAFGRLVEGEIGCDGLIDDVRIARGVMKPRKGGAPRLRMDNTLGLWDFDDLAALTGPAAPKPAAFTPERAPLNPQDHQHAGEFVNRERVFDYYGKQALHFMKQKPLPDLIPPFPGLDGGQQGHWGNQNDQTTWKDGRWSQQNHGSLFCGVFKGGGVTVPKGVCVRFDDKAAVFDPEKLTFPVTWSGGFIQLNDARHGFMAGAPMEGKVLARSDERREGRYLGFYRHGGEVIFAYEADGKTHYLNARGDAEAQLAPMTQGGPTQWPEWLETRGERGTQKPFATDRLTLPFENPYGTLFFVSAHDFFEDGRAVIATMTGEIWLVQGIDENLERLRWKRFATGLNQPLGVKICDGQLYVLGRDQITCLHDLNGDDEADYYECVTNGMQTSPGGHDFIVGLERDAEGRFYFASGNQGVCRVTGRDGLEVLATGLRNPNGLGLSPDGRFVTTSAQEGDWTPATSLFQIELDHNLGAHFGAGGPKDGQPPEPVLLYLPRGEDNSASSQAFVTGEEWSALQGQGNLVHLSSGGGSAWLVMRQNVRGSWQAAAMKISGNFDSGPQCARFNPHDGHLYVNGMQGWGSYTPRDGCFQRVRFVGGAPVPVGFEARDNGLLLHFDQPVANTDATAFFAQCWNYHYGPQYGSPEYSVRFADTPGHDPLEVRSVHPLPDGKSLFVEIPQLLPANQLHVHLSTGQDLFCTLHALGEPFVDYPGYRKIAKIYHAAQVGQLAPAAIQPNPWAQGKSGRELVVEAALGLQYVQKKLTAKAGERISLRFKNPDVVPHNWLLARPGSLQSLGEQCNLMIADPKGMEKHYVPESADVIAYTDMTNPKGEFVIHFNAPEEKGDYPYLCTFPGHWMVMNGVLKVE